MADPQPTQEYLLTTINLLRAELAQAQQERDALRTTATALLDSHVSLVNSGDCGFWNPEEDKEVIALRAALRAARGDQ